MTLALNVSSVAALLGRHKYKSKDEARLELFKKRHAIAYYKCLRRLGHTFDKQEQVHRLWRHLKNDPTYTALRDTAVQDDTKTNTIMQTLTARVASLNPDDMDAQTLDLVKDDLKRELKSDIWRAKGTLREKEGLDTYEQTHKTHINNRNARLYIMPCTSPQGYTYTLRGMIDGYEPSTDTVVDMKNRANRMFKTLPDYERVQLCIYMEMVQASKAKLLQRYNGDVHTLATLERDPKAWKDIKDQLDACVDAYMAFAKDLKAQDTFVRTHAVHTPPHTHVPKKRKI